MDHTPLLPLRASNHQIQLFLDRSGSGYNWRLLAANHREFGRGVELASSRAECLAAITAARAEPALLVPRARRVPMGRWTWELSFDGVPFARSVRIFDRLIRCEQILHGLVDNFCHATVSDVLVDMTDRRFVVTRPAVTREFA